MLWMILFILSLVELSFFGIMQLPIFMCPVECHVLERVTQLF